MNKLEALNSPKYSLTPEKMGELVGGEKVYVRSKGGTYKTPSHTITCNYDVKVYANEADRRHGMCENILFYGDGSNPE